MFKKNKTRIVTPDELMQMHHNAASSPKEKNLPLAIGLNLLLPGVGYIYFGKLIVGIFALLLVITIYARTGSLFIMQLWIGLNIIMALDMYILHNKNRLNNMKKCRSCAEMVKKEAVVCRYCKTSLAGNLT